MKGYLPDFVRARMDPAQRYGLRLTLLTFAVILVAVPFGLLLVQVLSDGPFTRIDTEAAEYLHEYARRSPVGIRVLQALSFMGKPVLFYVLIGAASLYLWRRGRRRLIAYLVATSALGGLIDTAVKILVNRPRPVFEDPIATAYGKSFPSGHAMSSTVIYGALLLVFLPVVSRRLRKWLIATVSALVAGIAFSRLALGVHFVSDVLGGIALGLAWLAASTAAFETWREERGKRPSHPLQEGLEPEAAADLRAETPPP
ncbi:MAG TPA: phosphatase PAP2 family protein [Actinomycetota bacterium]|nr:phosphatase PAP2 family protein [Actinomycetota bacterium]